MTVQRLDTYRIECDRRLSAQCERSVVILQAEDADDALRRAAQLHWTTWPLNEAWCPPCKAYFDAVVEERA